MKIAKDTVVTIDFVLKDSDGEVLDDSEGEPLAFLQGHGEMMPGLESALEGHETGETLSFVVAAKDGYGERIDSEKAADSVRQFFYRRWALLQTR